MRKYILISMALLIIAASCTNRERHIPMGTYDDAIELTDGYRLPMNDYTFEVSDNGVMYVYGNGGICVCPIDLEDYIDLSEDRREWATKGYIECDDGVVVKVSLKVAKTFVAPHYEYDVTIDKVTYRMSYVK